MLRVLLLELLRFNDGTAHDPNVCGSVLMDGKQASQLCRERGQHWRAAMLEGWRLYTDPAITTDDSNRDLEATGNWHRSLWKENAYAMSDDTDAFKDDFERAVYATLSGNLQQMATVCKGTWEGMLWAYYTVMVDFEIDAAILEQVHAEKTNPLIMVRRDYTAADPSLQNTKGGSLTPDSILNDHLREEGRLRDGANEPLHIVQAYIILGDMEKLVTKMREVLEEVTRRAPYGYQRTECLRIFAEIVIALDDLEDITEKVKDDASFIVHEYVKDLIQMEVNPDRAGQRIQRQTGIVAFYTNVLVHFLDAGSEEPVERYAEFLREVTDPEERKLCFNFAREHGLDTANISKRAVELTRGEVQMSWDDTATGAGLNTSNASAASAASTPPSSAVAIAVAAAAANGVAASPGGGGAAGDSMLERGGYEDACEYDEDADVNELDREKIEAIELLLYDDRQRAEALKQSNFVMREFMLDGKRVAVREVLEKIPEGSTELIERQCGLVQANGLITLSLEHENIIREFDSITVWCEALEAFEDWEEWQKTRRPTPPDDDAPATGRGAAARSHEQRAYTDRLGRWQERLDLKFKETRERLLAVIQFDGGWLMNQEEEEQEQEEYDEDGDASAKDPPVAERLRYIPEICEMYHEVLNEHGKFKECLQIADLIACPFEGTHLHDVYKHPENIPHLQELLRRIGLSARCIIEKSPNADTLGY